MSRTILAVAAMFCVTVLTVAWLLVRDSEDGPSGGGSPQDCTPANIYAC